MRIANGSKERKSVKSVKSVNFLGVYRKLENIKNTRESSFPYTPKKSTDFTDFTDHAEPHAREVCKVKNQTLQTLQTNFTDLLYFTRTWFTGFMGDLVHLGMREMFWCEGDLSNCRRKGREPWSIEGLETMFRMYVRDVTRTNILMGVGFWLISDELEAPQDENLMRYDRIFYDFDSREDPERAREAALEFAESIRKSYGVVPVVVDTGVKGAHVYVFLSNPIRWREYRGIWNYLLIKHGDRNLADRNVLQYNRLARVPYSYNVKEGRNVVTRIIYPAQTSPTKFRFDDIIPLDKVKVKVFVVEDPPLPQKIVVENVREARTVEWIEELIRNGLPDGRKRVLALAIIPYLVNVLKLSDDEVLERVRAFLRMCCEKHGRCEEISSRWVEAEVGRMREKGYGPIRYEKLIRDYRDLYELITGRRN